MNVAGDALTAVALAQVKPLVPGYLLTPFRWAAHPLAAIIQSEPGLLMHVFELDKPRMHVIALALAHLDGIPTPQFSSVLFRGSVSEILHNVVGRSPAGITRVLRRLPFAVLSRQGYLRLIELLDDPRSAKLLHHLNETEITESTIKVLHDIPSMLRPVLARLVRLIEKIEQLEHLPDGLRWLVSRGTAASFVDALIADLATQAQPGQFVAQLTKLVAELPLPQTLPPVQIGKAERIDGTADICALAKRFKNCLANFLTQIDAGGCAVYLWDDPTAPAVCLVTRQGRLGWALSEALGPKNAKLDRKQLQEIITAFAEVDIPQYCAIRSLECILKSDTTMPRTRRQRRQAWEQRLWPELEEAAWIQNGIEVID